MLDFFRLEKCTNNLDVMEPTNLTNIYKKIFEFKPIIALLTLIIPGIFKTIYPVSNFMMIRA